MIVQITFINVKVKSINVKIELDTSL